MRAARGKGGGVKLVRSADEAREAAEAMLGMQLVTHQTGPEGQLVRRLWVEEGLKYRESELYVGIVVDRERQLPVMMASSEGADGHRRSGCQHPGADPEGALHPGRRG